jgi:hypothetical protein
MARQDDECSRGVSLRFPGAATGGFFDTGGDPERLKLNDFVTAATRRDNTTEPSLMIYHGDVIPVEYVPSEGPLSTAEINKDEHKAFANIGVNAEGYKQPYWRSVLLYKQRPLAILRWATLWCLFANRRFYLTRAQWIWLCNLVCLILHAIMAGLTFERGGRNPKGMEVPIWRIEQVWNNNTAMGYTVDLVENWHPIRIDHLTGGFFTLSAVAHLFAVLVGPFDRWINLYWRQIDLAFLYWCAPRRARPRSQPSLTTQCASQALARVLPLGLLHAHRHRPPRRSPRTECTCLHLDADVGDADARPPHRALLAPPEGDAHAHRD